MRPSLMCLSLGCCLWLGGCEKPQPPAPMPPPPVAAPLLEPLEIDPSSVKTTPAHMPEIREMQLQPTKPSTHLLRMEKGPNYGKVTRQVVPATNVKKGDNAAKK